METWTKQDTIYDGHIFRVSAGEVSLEDGTVAQREIVEHPGGVGIIPSGVRTNRGSAKSRLSLPRAIEIVGWLRPR